MYVAQSGIPKPIRRSPMRLRWYGGICGIIFIFPCHNRRPTWYKSRGLYSSALWTRCPMPRRWIKSRLERVAELHRRSSMPPIFLLPYPFPFVSIPIPSNTPIFYLVNATKSRMNLFRLNDKIDLGPAISSVCQRRSLGLLNLYRLLFRVPITPSVCPRSLRICSRTASATDQGRFPLG